MITRTQDVRALLIPDTQKAAKTTTSQGVWWLMVASRLYIEGLEASLRWLKRKSPDLDRFRVDALIPRHGQQAAENTGQCASIGGLLEPENLPPALMPAQCGNADGLPLNPLLILIVGVAAIAYFVTGGSVPPPDATSEPNLTEVDLKKATIAPPSLALQSEIQPTQLRNDNPDRQTLQTGKTSSSAAPDRIFADRIEEREDDAGGPKRTSDVADFSGARQPRADSPASRESRRAIHGIRRCPKLCTGSKCAPIGDCASRKKGSRRAQVPPAR
jgi:hypothetical protein